MGRPPRDGLGTGKLVALVLAAALGGLIGGIALGPVLWQPPPSGPGEVLWPLQISVDFDRAPANATLDMTVVVKDENRTLGSAHYVVGRPPEGGDKVILFLKLTLRAVPQALQVVFDFHDGGVTALYIDVHPNDPFASPRLYFFVTYGTPPGSPMKLDGWRVDVQKVG